MRLIVQIAIVFAFSLMTVGCLDEGAAPKPSVGSGATTSSTNSPNANASQTSSSPSGANPAQGQSVVEQAATAEQWQQDFKRLKALGVAYINLIDSRGNGPAGWQDLPQSPEMTSLQEAGCIVKWSKHFRDAPNGTSQYALAYLPETPEKGGAVLLMDGAVSRLSSQEVKEMLAAQGE